MNAEPSKLQRAICDILRGEASLRMAHPRDTGELLAELAERRLLDEHRPRKQLMATIVRACWSLQIRGLVSGVRVPKAEHIGRETIRWSLAHGTAPPTEGVPATVVRLADEDREVLDTLQRVTGQSSPLAVIRLALREALAAREVESGRQHPLRATLGRHSADSDPAGLP